VAAKPDQAGDPAEGARQRVFLVKHGEKSPDFHGGLETDRGIEGPSSQ